MDLERFELSSFCLINGRPVAVAFGAVGELPWGSWANEEGFPGFRIIGFCFIKCVAFGCQACVGRFGRMQMPSA